MIWARAMAQAAYLLLVETLGREEKHKEAAQMYRFGYVCDEENENVGVRRREVFFGYVLWNVSTQ